MTILDLYSATSLASCFLLATIILLIITVPVVKTIYNIYFHPLRGFPGPRLWAATHLPWTYYRITGQLVWKNVELHEKYGHVVRVAPDHLTFITESAWNTIYGLRAEEMQKNCLAGFSRPGIKGAHSVLSADKSNHTRLRRILAPALSDRAVKEHEPIFLKHINRLVHQIRDRISRGNFDLNRYFEWTAMDLISDIVFGQPDNALEKEDGGKWLFVLTNAIRSQVLIQAIESYGLISWRSYLLPDVKVNAAIENFKIISQKLEARLTQNGEHKDVLSYVLAQDGDKGMSKIEIPLNMATIIGAGTGTTATWLSTCIHSLTTNPAAYDKLSVEIRETFASDSDITIATTVPLPYLSAVMQEALRIHCPSPSDTGRIVPASGEVIDGSFVPGGTTVGVHQNAAYHSLSNFHEPTMFHPERWLDEARLPTSPFSSDRLGVVKPFSHGPRTCLGIKLSNTATRLILAKLIWHFDFQISPESIDWQFSQKGTVAWHRTPLICGVRVKTGQGTCDH